MRRYLVVANVTLGGEHLLEVLRERVRQGPCAIHVLVPATAQQGTWLSDEDREVALARERLAEALEQFGALGASEVTGAVCESRPVDSVQDALRERPYDEVILSTLPPGISRWLKLDLIHRLERAVDVPVTHVVAQPVPA